MPRSRGMPMSDEIIYRFDILVPYHKKDIAKQHGALWCPSQKTWFFYSHAYYVDDTTYSINLFANGESRDKFIRKTDACALIENFLVLAYDLKILDLIKGKRYDTVEEYYKAIDRYESDRVEHVKKSDLPKKRLVNLLNR